MTNEQNKQPFLQSLKSVDLPHHFEALEAAAKEKIPPPHFGYIQSGASNEETMRENSSIFDKYKIIPRFLTNVEKLDTSITLFEKTYPSPFLIAPVGMLKLAHEEAELAVARAAERYEIPFIQSTVSSYSIEDVVNETPDSSKWFQLYWSVDETVAYSMVERAEKLGYEAIVLTIDTIMLGYRVTDQMHQFSPLKQGFGKANYETDGAFIKSLTDTSDETVIQKIIENVYHPHLNWDHIIELKKRTKLPILLKGILHPEDARLAVKVGVDGIIVSNHGGRQLDGLISSLDALNPIVEIVNKEIPVLFDSGIRSGPDVVKALALGADAILIGRPFVYGLAIDGQNGVEHVLENLINETRVSLSLAGASNINNANQIKIIKA